MLTRVERKLRADQHRLGRRAIKLVMKGAAYVELASSHVIRAVIGGISLPSVVRLLVYRKMPRLNRSVSRKSIMLRDRHTCQYCNRNADRTPAEAGMPLARKPAPFGIHAKHRLMIGDESAWDKYLC
jgi:hypothetical protein